MEYIHHKLSDCEKLYISLLTSDEKFCRLQKLPRKQVSVDRDLKKDTANNMQWWNQVQNHLDNADQNTSMHSGKENWTSSGHCKSKQGIPK